VEPTLAIAVSDLSKRYRLGRRERNRTLREVISSGVAAPLRRVMRRRAPRRHAEELPARLWALDGISFEVKHGEVLGIIGRNGAGKSTLLKVLSRITEPTSGEARITGRVGSLLEVGTGFHPELTGRENISLNGAILGMRRDEIQGKFDEIVAFAEVERFLDVPVKHYSSGMYLRLAFAVAAHLEPEILLVDEVLAVGDQAFQAKCIKQMEQIGGAGRTVLFVSHNLAAIRSLCSRVILLADGRVTADGPADLVIEQYLRRGGDLDGDVDLTKHPLRTPGMAPVLRRVRLCDSRGHVVTSIPTGDALRVLIDLELPGAMRHVDVWLALHDALGDRIALFSTVYEGTPFDSDGSALTVACEVPSLPLVTGRYSMWLWVSHTRQKLDLIEDAVAFDVVAADFYGTGKIPERSGRGKVLLRSTWRVASS